jgi:hypothetical protein
MASITLTIIGRIGYLAIRAIFTFALFPFAAPSSEAHLGLFGGGEKS